MILTQPSKCKLLPLIPSIKLNIKTLNTTQENDNIL